VRRLVGALRRRLVAVAHPRPSAHSMSRAPDAPSQADKSVRGESGDKSPALQNADSDCAGRGSFSKRSHSNHPGSGIAEAKNEEQLARLVERDLMLRVND